MKMKILKYAAASNRKLRCICIRMENMHRSDTGLPPCSAEYLRLCTVETRKLRVRRLHIL